MKKIVSLIAVLMGLYGCPKAPEVLYQSPQFTIYPNKVVQGNFTATVESPTKIVSNYHSLAYENFSRMVSFKFGINEKDNEKQSGENHWIIIGDEEHQSPVIVFGQKDQPNPGDPGVKLPVNYAYTFRLDMRPVLKQFAEKGSFETFDGTRISKDDFKGVYIAGGTEPLSWDWVNLEEKGFDLKDPDGDSIYEIKVVFNPFDEKENKPCTWQLTENVSMKPSYHSDQPIVDALFNLSLEEARKNIEPDSTLRTGAKWGGVWTRDVSFSTLLAFAYHEPKVAEISLMKKVKRGRIIQDTGSGGAWPISSDRTSWSLAAWEIYKVTGDEAWLKSAYQIIKNTLADDGKTIRSPKTGMNRGESSFLDWREQTYPKWMSNTDIYLSENLGTNAVHYEANLILAQMAKILGEPNDAYLQRAEEIKKGMNQYLWMADKGYYGQYLYGRSSMNLSPRFEALGEAFSVLFGVADEAKAQSIFENSPVTAFGTTCIYPQIPGIPPYHNNAIWPFVQSFWNLAAAKTGNEAALLHGLAAIYRAGALFLTNYENMVAQNGDFNGTEINSDRMLWSMAGNMAMVHRVFIGMSFEPGGIRFQPVVPEVYGGTKTLSNFSYRKAKLDITVKGFGNKIASFKLDGKAIDEPFFPGNLEGKHQIEINLANNRFGATKINLVENKFSLTNPLVKLEGKKLVWDVVPGAVSYNVYKNGKIVSKVSENQFDIEKETFAEYKVTAVDPEGVESFTSEPVWITNSDQLVEVEQSVAKSTLPYTNYSGAGFVEISSAKNRDMALKINVPEAGVYLLECRYANGTGPWNTDNNCGIRSVYVNDVYSGVWVFPQRGTNEWSDWGFSNLIETSLQKGNNMLRIKFEDWNINMDGEINDALLDYIRVVKR
ncbi:MAG TPA: hypothetical protein PKH79_10245 [Prolixibacteraceae bacterium]|nr:hypothetical protein [Prolixibacteraceae bacterium]